MEKDKRGGKREGAGRKPSPFPIFTKEFRATEEERAEFLQLLPGDAREDFEQVVNALKSKKASASAEAGSE